MDDSKTFDPAVLLDKVARLYPGGVPNVLIQAPREEPKVLEAAPRVLFIVVHSSGTVPAADADFLVSVASKGMKLSESEYTVSTAADLSQAEELLRKVCSTQQPRAAIIFGAPILSGPEPLDGLSSEAGRVLVLRGPELSHLASNADAKRNFWKVLQGILPHVAGG